MITSIKKTLFALLALITLSVTSTITVAEDLTIGTTSYSPPFILSTAGGIYTGFDPALMSMLCKELNFTCHYKIYYFEDLEKALNKKEIDAAIAGISITHNRSKRVNFSTPYLPSNAHFIANNTVKNTKISSTNLFDYRKDLLGKRIGVTRGSTYERRLNDMLPDHNFLKSFSTDHHAMEALIEQKLDLVLTDDLSANYWKMTSGDKLYLYGKTLPIGEGYGIMFAKNRENLVQLFDRELLKAQNDGRFLKLYNRFFSLN